MASRWGKEPNQLSSTSDFHNGRDRRHRSHFHFQGSTTILFFLPFPFRNAEFWLKPFENCRRCDIVLQTSKAAFREILPMKQSTPTDERESNEEYLRG
jgi:hypothetical protein